MNTPDTINLETDTINLETNTGEVVHSVEYSQPPEERLERLKVVNTEYEEDQKANEGEVERLKELLQEEEKSTKDRSGD